MNTDWQNDRVGSAIRGVNPTVMSRLRASFAVIGDIQFLPGYSIAISDTVGVDRLSDLSRPDRLAFLGDMDLLGEAVERVCSRFDSGFLRVNLEILGNTDGFLHAHVWPRYSWEGEQAKKPVWLYPGENWGPRAILLGPEHDLLREALTSEVTKVMSALEADI